MNALIWLFDTVVQLFIYVLIASAVLSWLVALLYRLTEPVLRPIRNLLPNLGGVDISPIILILLLLFISRLLHEYAVPATYVYAQ
jgi:YggT family protein